MTELSCEIDGSHIRNTRNTRDLINTYVYIYIYLLFIFKILHNIYYTYITPIISCYITWIRDFFTVIYKSCRK